jgi:hypothetical protein
MSILPHTIVNGEGSQGDRISRRLSSLTSIHANMSEYGHLNRQRYRNPVSPRDAEGHREYVGSKDPRLEGAIQAGFPL